MNDYKKGLENIKNEYVEQANIIEEFINSINEIDIEKSKEESTKFIDAIIGYIDNIEIIKKDINELLITIKKENIRLNAEEIRHLNNKPYTNEYDEMTARIKENESTIEDLINTIKQYDILEENLIISSKKVNEIINNNLRQNDEKIEQKDNLDEEYIDDNKKVEEQQEDKKEEVSEIETTPELNSEYEKSLEEYLKLLEIYNEDLERLYELQEKYDNNEIDYSEYKKYAEYMAERYNYLMEAYKKLSELIEKNNDKLADLTNEELQKQLAELEQSANEIWNQQVQVENGETPDNTLDKINEKIKLIKEELKKRKENPLRGLSNEELQNKKNELYKKIAEQQNEDEYQFRTHQENGLEGYEKDDIDKGLKAISDEIERRNKKDKLPERPNQPMMILGKEKDPVPPEPIPEPVPEPNKYTLEGIIQKIIGNEYISSKQSKHYMASQIKVYNKLPKNNWGNAYKLISIPRRIGAILMIPFNGIKKLIGKIRTTEETKNSVKEMQKRIDELTDEEVEVFLKQYKGTTALGFKLPKLFNEMIRARIIKYITPKINQINSKISELLAQIEFHKKIADGIEVKLSDPKLTEEEKTKLNNLQRQAYTKCAQEIKEMYSLKREGNELQSGNGLHAVEEELNATNSKMNYKGGRFAKDGEIDSNLWKVLGQTADAIEHSNNPYAVVDAYFKQKETYLRNTEEKRSFLNLGSKVSSGKLDYRPFVENLYYGNDPYVSDLISSILLVSSAINVANSIMTNVKNANKISQYNKQLEDLQTDLNNSGTTLEDGLISDIRRNSLDSENLAERSINDSHNYKLGTQQYKYEDAIHHTETAEFSTYCEDRISDLTSQYNSGTLTHPQFIKELEKVRTESSQFYENYISKYSQNLEDYSKLHPEFDYTAILNGLKGVGNSQGASASMTNYLVQIYDKAYQLINFNNISSIEENLLSQSLIPPIITAAAATSKVASESNSINKKANSTEWDKEGKFTELLEMIKRGELLTNQTDIDQAVEDSIKTGRVL